MSEPTPPAQRALPSGHPHPRQVPSVGRVVHIREYHDGPCLPAIVTEVHQEGNPESVLGLTVFSPTGTHYTTAMYGEVPVGFRWHWPERVDPH